MKRRTFIKGLGAAVALAPGVTWSSARGARVPGSANPHLMSINPEFLVSPETVRAWHVAKDSQGGPTLAGSSSWRNFVDLAEKELRGSGLVDVFRNPWSYKRWFTAD